MVQALDERPRTAGSATESIRVAAQEFGCAMNDEISAPAKRILVDRTCERVVDGHEGADAVRRLRQARNVNDFHGRIGRGLQIEKLAAARDLGFDLREVRGVAQPDLDAERRQELREELVRTAVAVLDGHDAITGPQKCEERSADRGHAGGEARGSLGALEVPDLLL